MLQEGSLTFAADGKELFGSARELNQPGQPPWTIGVIIPVEDVMAGVYRNDRWAIWAGMTCPDCCPRLLGPST